MSYVKAIATKTKNVSNSSKLYTLLLLDPRLLFKKIIMQNAISSLNVSDLRNDGFGLTKI